MAPPLDNLHLSTPLPLPSLSTRRRCSKAQMCFFNILHVISVFPKPDVTHVSQNKQLLLDLNIAVAENCVCKSELESSAAEERAQEHSEISHVGDQSSGIEQEKPRDEGYLGLLFEAAQLILGDNSEQNKKPQDKKPATARGGGKRKQQCWTAAAEAEWYAEFEDTSPVVKSKRGRNQVLPFKYRDSVVEPLVRWASTTVTRRSK